MTSIRTLSAATLALSLTVHGNGFQDAVPLPLHLFDM